jgi:hypothetical protein
MRSAEFAKEAMAQQRVPGGDLEGFLDVRWANEDPNPRAQAREKRRHADTYCQARRARPPCRLCGAPMASDKVLPGDYLSQPGPVHVCDASVPHHTAGLSSDMPAAWHVDSCSN